jgi:hypothetical protein
MTRKELREIIMAAAEEAVKDHQRADGSNDWIIQRIRSSPKDGYGWFWIKYLDPLSILAQCFGGVGRPPSKALCYLGDVVANAQRQHVRERRERRMNKAG